MKPVKKQTKAGSTKRQPTKRQSGRKQSASTSASSKTPDQGAESQFPLTVRFSATIHAPRTADRNWIEKLDIDRIPDPQGLVRALVTTADCVRLLDQGFEVHLHQAYPVQPMNPALIETDDSFKRWLDQRVQSIKGAKKQKE